MTRSDAADDRDSGRFAYDGLERVFHEKARLGILTSLVTHPEGLAFGDLKSLCSLTDGNLNRHLAVLEDAGLLEIRKESTDRRPRTFVTLTKAGRTRFLEYVAELERIVADAAAASATADRRPRRGWSPA